MKIGIFDSGLGGLIIAKSIVKAMPKYDYVYLGDTKRVPYGNRSEEAVFEFTRECVDYLFRKENCAIVILACNTASARALRRIQKEYPHQKILGVLIPAAEEAAKFKKVGVIGTLGTISSNTFVKEIKKINQKTLVWQNPAPMLVPLAEAGELALAKPFLLKYLAPLLKKKIDALVLGCTHYPIFKDQIKKEIKKTGRSVKIISQDEIVPKKLKNYFFRHPEIQNLLSKRRSLKVLVTDLTRHTKNLSPKLINL